MGDSQGEVSQHGCEISFIDTTAQELFMWCDTVEGGVVQCGEQFSTSHFCVGAKDSLLGRENGFSFFFLVVLSVPLCNI